MSADTGSPLSVKEIVLVGLMRVSVGNRRPPEWRRTAPSPACGGGSGRELFGILTAAAMNRSPRDPLPVEKLARVVSAPSPPLPRKREREASCRPEVPDIARNGSEELPAHHASPIGRFALARSARS